MARLARRLCFLALLTALGSVPRANTRLPQNSLGISPSPLQNVDWSKYSPDVQELLRTTYLGHGNQLPDPEESADVLRRYLALGSHQRSDDSPDLDGLNQEISEWTDLASANPESRHAALGLAALQLAKAEIAGDREAQSAAAASYVRAAEIAMAHGLVRYTREVSTSLVASNDIEQLKTTFASFLETARTPKDKYLALVDYADGLARLGDSTAVDYFQAAIETNPANNIEAINRYSRYLLDRHEANDALALLDTLSPIERMMHGLPIVLRKEALEQLGADTQSVEQELEVFRTRAQGSVIGGVPGPALGGANGEVQPKFVHYYQTDDCRDDVYNSQLWCGPDWCWLPFTVNLGEILWNEARGESIGAQAMVAWTVRDRVRQGIGCDVYVGGVNYWTGWCEYLPCTFPYPLSAQCETGKRYCCAEHGATFGWGSYQVQFNDAHQILDDLINSGTIYRAFYTQNGWMPEISTNFIPPGVGNCVNTCTQMFCSYGSNDWSPSPLGPMEYLSYVYTPPGAGDCKWSSGFVCSWTGYSGNYFWNRSY